MLGGNKKAQPRGQDWFVVLNPLKSELDRNRIAKEIAQKIKDELDYPGMIKITVIREMRAVEYAR